MTTQHGLSPTTPQVPRSLHAVAAVLGGVIWTLVPILYNLGDPLLGYRVEYGIVVALAPPFLIAGVWGFYQQYGPSYSRWGRGGLWLLAAGVLGLWPFALIEFVPIGFGIGILTLVIAVAGGVVAALGAIGLGIDCWRTAVPSRWMGLWFPLAFGLAAALNYWAAHLHDYLWLNHHYYAGLSGVAWIGLGALLWRAP